jgi:hypothetical protein
MPARPEAMPYTDAPTAVADGHRPHIQRTFSEPFGSSLEFGAPGIKQIGRASRERTRPARREGHHVAVGAGSDERMDPSFSERSLGFRSFSDFFRSRSDLVDLDESSTTRMVRLHSDT